MIKHWILIMLLWPALAMGQDSIWSYAYNGNAGYQYTLATYYVSGENGYKRDLAQAYKWALIASRQGHWRSKLLVDEISPSISSDVKSEAALFASKRLAAYAKAKQAKKAKAAKQVSTIKTSQAAEKERFSEKTEIILIFSLGVLIYTIYGLRRLPERRYGNKFTSGDELLNTMLDENKEIIEKKTKDREASLKKKIAAEREKKIAADEKRERDEAIKAEQEATEKKLMLAAEQARKAAAEKAKIEAEEHERLRKVRLLKTMKHCLPFYCSVKEKEGSQGIADSNRWEDVNNSISSMDETPTTLYFVKLLSLLDDREYYKIGITTKTVEQRFETSTQVELLDTIATFETFQYMALFAEYHFIREFSITPEISQSLDIDEPNVKFSGASEIVRPNSVRKIKSLFDKLPLYEHALKQSLSDQLNGILKNNSP